MLSFNSFFNQQIVSGVSNREVDFSFFTQDDPRGKPQIPYIANHFNFLYEDLVRIQQVHEDHILIVQKEDAAVQGAEADGIITNKSQLPIAIRTADCLPVFLYDSITDCIGLIHAGWKGTQKGIVLKAITLMHSHFQAKVEGIKVVMGPCIRECCYEVGSEFKEIFPEDVVLVGDKVILNLSQSNKRQMIEAGIRKTNIYDCGICTCCDPQYFSYRREGKAAGRMISVMMIKEGSDADCSSCHN